MVRNYKRKEVGGRANYSNNPQMVNAYNAVMAGEMSAFRAARHFGVNHKAVWLRTSGQIPVNAHQGRSTDLPATVEQELVTCVLLMADWGWGFSAAEVKDIIQDYVKANKIHTQFLDGRPGSDWMSSFLQRHPEISRRTTEHLSRGRKEAENPEILAHWFALLDQTLTNAGVKDHPEQIFNADETGFVTDPKSDIVLARRGSRRVNQTIGGSGKEQVTVNCAGSASGKVLPPYVVYKGKNLYKDWIKGGPEGTVFNTSTNGWMESQHFYEWFKKQFLPFTEELSTLPRILIFDGHLSHLSVEIVSCARENNVVLLRLPAKLTHLLQPFDKTVFRPVKQKWQQLLKQYARTHRGPVGKAMFPKMLKELYEKSFSSSIIQSGFRSCGICPFDPNAVKLDNENPVPLASPCTADRPTAVLGPPNSLVDARPSMVSDESHPSTSTTPTAAHLQSSSSTAADPRPSSTTADPGPSTLTAADPGPSSLTAADPGPSSTAADPRPSSSTAADPGPSSSTASDPRPSSSTAADPGLSSSTASSRPPSASGPSTPSASGTSNSPSASQDSSSIKDFFLQRMAASSFVPRGRSARVQRFKYGEALTEDQCLQRLQEEESAKGKGKGKGPAKGKRRGRGRPAPSPQRSRSPLSNTDDSDADDLCRRCGSGGGVDWIACDICDAWFHAECASLDLPLEAMREQEWMCDFCSQ